MSCVVTFSFSAICSSSSACFSSGIPAASFAAVISILSFLTAFSISSPAFFLTVSNLCNWPVDTFSVSATISLVRFPEICWTMSSPFSSFPTMIPSYPAFRSSSIILPHFSDWYRMSESFRTRVKPFVRIIA